jgi:hypothetical protein
MKSPVMTFSWKSWPKFISKLIENKRNTELKHLMPIHYQTLEELKTKNTQIQNLQK